MVPAPVMAGHRRRGGVAMALMPEGLVPNALVASALVGRVGDRAGGGTMMRRAVMMRRARRHRLVRGVLMEGMGHGRCRHHHRKHRRDSHNPWHLQEHLHSHSANSASPNSFIRSPTAKPRAIRLYPLLADCRLRTRPARARGPGGKVENRGHRAAPKAENRGKRRERMNNIPPNPR